MNEIIKFAKYYLQYGEVERVSESFWEVGKELEKHTVKLEKGNGKNNYTCDCENFTRFCNSFPICSHIYAVIIFEATFPYQYKINKLIKEYEQFKKIKMAPDIDAFLEDLKIIRGFL